MIENFEAIETKSRLLRHHSIIAEEFHNKYRLWIVTSECDDVSELLILTIMDTNFNLNITLMYHEVI